MDRAELVWRAGAAARIVLDRARVAMTPPKWRRGDLAGVLAQLPELQVVRRAAARGDWLRAHRELSAYFSDTAPRFVIAPSLRDATVARIRARFPDSAREAAMRGDRITHGEYDLLGYRNLKFGGAGGQIDWHYDPVHERHAPVAFWSTVPYLDPACGDHKVIWELNRHQHWLALGRAHWLTGDPRYRTRALRELAAWLDANPPLVGINWASMLELSLRALSWLWAINLFADPAADDAVPWLADLLVGLDRQLDHVEQNLSYYFSPNTHLLGEALALYVTGRALPALRASERRAATGRAVLLDQMHHQIAADGGHCERSTHYHRYTLDFYLLALAVARVTGDPAADEFQRAVARLGFAARLLADDRGQLPHIGDDDGGSMLPLTGRAVDDIRDSLAAAAALVGRADLKIREIPEECFWLLAHPDLASALDRIAAAPAAEPIGSAALPDTGYYVSRSPAGDHLVVDAGVHGYQNGGHAHADALSLTFSLRGVPLLIDSGTGCYTVNAALRERLRSTYAHNTLVLDEAPQSSPAGPFHWTRTVDGTAHVWRANAGFDYLEASHDAYRPVEHRRHVLALHGDVLIVADLVEGDGLHRADVHWHVDPRWRVAIDDRRAVLACAGERVELMVTEAVLEMFTGDADSGLGWHAPVYGRVEPATTIRVSHSGAAPMWIVSVFGFNRANSVLDVETLPVWAEAGVLKRSIAVRLTREASSDVFVIAHAHSGEAGALSNGTRADAHVGSGFSRTSNVNPAKAGSRSSAIDSDPRVGSGFSRTSNVNPANAGSHSSAIDSDPRVGSGFSRTWRVGELETDARMLFYRTGATGDATSAAIVDGSLIRSSARRKFALSLPREVPDLHVDLGVMPNHLSVFEARLSGRAFGARVELAGCEVPIAIERRSTTRMAAKRKEVR
jgi:hypothetical protein